MMKIREIPPSREASTAIECYWHIEDAAAAARTVQKIIPDGRPEIVVHLGDPYQIKVESDWQLQSRTLLAGQFRHFFYLRNTGVINMLGVKFRPWALGLMYGLSMHKIVDTVYALKRFPEINIPWDQITEGDLNVDEAVSILDETLAAKLTIPFGPSPLINVLSAIQHHNGLVKIGKLCRANGISERSLERFCSKNVGVSPKFLARIFRMNYIFKLMQERQRSWTELAFESGYFDQSHFIKNFKEFTGEDPSKYVFDADTMANYFLKR